MSKALIITGSDFSVNKVTTVTIASDPIPCQSLSISPSSIASSDIGETYTLTPAVTPIDTTDHVSYGSSDTDVATVTSDGIVTIVGIGTTTITATCGQQTATCLVTVTDISVPINYIVGSCAPNEAYGASFESSILNRFSGVGTITDGAVATAEVVDARSASPYYNKVINAIPIPNGATKIHCHQVGAPTYGSIKVAFFDGTTAGNSTYRAMLKSVGSVAPKLVSSDIDIEIQEGATKITFAMNVGGTYLIDQDANALAEALELAITFR